MNLIIVQEQKGHWGICLSEYETYVEEFVPFQITPEMYGSGQTKAWRSAHAALTSRLFGKLDAMYCFTVQDAYNAAGKACFMKVGETLVIPLTPRVKGKCYV